MSELHEAAFRAGVWSVIAARAKELADQAKQELQSLEVGDTVAGRYDGQIVAKATKTKGRRRVEVTDHDRYVEWVAERWPTEIVRDVNAAFDNHILKVAIDRGALVDDDGEVCPFVEVSEGSPYITVRREKDAPSIVAQLLSSGALSLEDTPAIRSAHWNEDEQAGAIG